MERELSVEARLALALIARGGQVSEQALHQVVTGDHPRPVTPRVDIAWTQDPI